MTPFLNGFIAGFIGTWVLILIGSAIAQYFADRREWREWTEENQQNEL